MKDFFFLALFEITLKKNLTDFNINQFHGVDKQKKGKVHN